MNRTQQGSKVTCLPTSDKKGRCWRYAAFRLFACISILAGAPIGEAAAAYTCSDAKGATVNLPVAASYTQSRDLANGTMLTDWTTVDSGDWYTCTITNGYLTYGYYGQTFMESAGVSYNGSPVSKTNVPGVGVMVRVRIRRGGAPLTDWKYGVWSTVKTSNSGTITVGGEFQIAIVKYGPIGSGTIKTFPLSAYRVGGDSDEWYGKGGYDRKYVFPDVTVTAKSCTTPDVIVNLGDYSVAALPNIGSRTTLKRFTLQVNSCSPDMASVYYGFNFSGTTGYSGKDGRFGLTSTATAKGVNVKLLNGDGTAVVELDKWYTLTSYNKAVGGSYTVPLSAAYERVGDLTPGTADAELVIAMSYN